MMRPTNLQEKKLLKVFLFCFCFWLIMTTLSVSLSAEFHWNKLLSSYHRLRAQLEIYQDVFLLLHASYFLIQMPHISQRDLLTQSSPTLGQTGSTYRLFRALIRLIEHAFYCVNAAVVFLFFVSEIFLSVKLLLYTLYVFSPSDQQVQCIEKNYTTTFNFSDFIFFRNWILFTKVTCSWSYLLKYTEILLKVLLYFCIYNFISY